MVKINFTRLQGSMQFRNRILLATLSGIPILIEEIRSEDSSPGLRPYEVSLLRLVEKVTDGCYVEINETGTKLKYKPGVIAGGRNLVHDCGLSRSIGYFLVPLIVLGLFGKKNLSIVLKGITNDDKDPCIDTFRMNTLHMLKRFGVPSEGLQLKIISRGSPPGGGGEVHLQIPMVPTSLSAVHWVDEGKVKRIRGVTFSTKVSPQMGNRIVSAARGILNRLLPDVYVFTDHRTDREAGESPGYGVSLVAETNTNCLVSAEVACHHRKDELEDLTGDEEKQMLVPPEDVGTRAASMLLEQIEQGGVVDSTHQELLLMLCALCPQDVSKVRLGKLTPNTIQTLRSIKALLGVTFDINPDVSNKTVVLKCMGCGYKNLSRKLS